MFEALLKAIVDDDRPAVATLLTADAGLAIHRVDEPRLYEDDVFHWLYVGDTALHLAAAGYRVEIVDSLLAVGADPAASANHRRSRPIHYASDGRITGPAWSPERQVRTLHLLIEAGADVHVQDANGATPLHRAVRTRCAAAVEYLLSVGADARARNKSGSTPFHLAVQNTGRGGSGEAAAKDAQERIIGTFLSIGLDPGLEDGRGSSVFDCARSDQVRKMLTSDRASPS